MLGVGIGWVGGWVGGFLPTWKMKKGFITSFKTMPE